MFHVERSYQALGRLMPNDTKPPTATADAGSVRSDGLVFVSLTASASLGGCSQWPVRCASSTERRQPPVNGHALGGWCFLSPVLVAAGDRV